MRFSPLCLITICTLLIAAAPATQPATQPSKQAAERAEILKAHVSTFSLTLDFNGQEEKPYYRLYLSVPEMNFKMEKNAFHQHVQITEDEAKKIIDQLVAGGFLDQAWKGGLRTPIPPNGNYYTMMARVTGIDPPTQIALYEEYLPFSPAMFERFDGLRKALDGDAAKAMDFLLGRVSGERKEIQRAEKK